MPATRTQGASQASKPSSTAKPRSKQPQDKKSSVDRLHEDIAAEAAGPPKKLTRTEHKLERSKTSIAPPAHVHGAGATIPPHSTRVVSSRMRADSNSENEGKNAKKDSGGKESTTDASKEDDVSASELSEDITLELKDTVTPGKIGMQDNERTPRQEILKRARGLSTVDSGEIKKISRLTFEHDSASSARSASVSGTENLEHDSANSAPSISVSDGENVPSKSPSLYDSDEYATSSSGLQGASRITGGFSRGRAAGNILNIGDMNSSIDEITSDKPIEGRVFLYKNSSKERSSALSINTSIKNKLGEVLKELAVLYSLIQKSNCRVFVDEDNSWAIKGKFNTAVESKEPLNWMVNKQNNKMFASIFAEGLVESDSVKSSSAVSQSPVTTSKTVTASTGNFTTETLNETQELIVSTFKISPALLENKRKDIKFAWMKHEAYLDIAARLKVMIANGNWPNEMPSDETIKSIFFGVSTYARYYRKVFAQVTAYEDIVAWLRSDPDAPETTEIWGDKKQTAYNLMEIIDERKKTEKGIEEDEEADEEEEEEVKVTKSKKSKGKAKAKDSKKKSHKRM
ncbi:hypothetical protein H0H92_006367 [Tricholoma furcatifolium]|nr:hypothetical protein H0H92_006367 [Tricholoma furcatifolium]